MVLIELTSIANQIQLFHIIGKHFVVGSNLIVTLPNVFIDIYIDMLISKKSWLFNKINIFLKMNLYTLNFLSHLKNITS